MILKSFVGLMGAGMVSLALFGPKETLAVRPLSWNMLVCISSPELTNSGRWAPIWVTNSTPADGMKATSLCEGVFGFG